MSASNQYKTTEKSIPIEGGRLGYSVAGKADGAVVICLPGMADTRREYEYLAPALLEAGYRVILTELRGNGASQGKFKSYEMADLSGDIATILDAEGVQQAYLAACSISGASAGYFAIQHPERVRGLLLFSPIFYSGGAFMTTMLSTMIATPGVGVGLWTSYFKSLYTSRPLEADYVVQMQANLRQSGGIRSLSRMARVRHLDEKTAQIKSPALIFLGDKDKDYKDAHAEAQKIQQAMPHANINVIAGIGHYPQREAANEVIPTVMGWLKTH